MAKRMRISDSRRQLLLQVVLVVVLLGATGLAGLTIRQIDRATEVPLGSPLRAATLELRLPEGWQVQSDSADEAAVVIAGSPRSEQPKRLLEVQHVANPRNLTPEEFLSVNGVLPRDYHQQFTSGAPVAQLSMLPPMTVDGAQAMAVQGRRVITTAQGAIFIHEVFICSQAGGTLILLKLQAQQAQPFKSDQSDIRLARDVAQSIHVVQGFAKP